MLVWTINLCYTVPTSSSECWQSDSELGWLVTAPSVTAVLEQLTRLRPASDPARVSLLGRLGCFGFSVSKELSTAQSKAGAGVWSLWSVGLWPSRETSREKVTVALLLHPTTLPRKLPAHGSPGLFISPRIHNPARTCSCDPGLGIISTRIDAALWLHLSVLLWWSLSLPALSLPGMWPQRGQDTEGTGHRGDRTQRAQDKVPGRG